LLQTYGNIKKVRKNHPFIFIYCTLSQYLEVTKTSTKHNTEGRRKMREETSIGELKRKGKLGRYICRWDEKKANLK
jgi:hypothetical protein